MSTNRTTEIVVTARIENLFDLHEVNFGVRATDRARVVEVEDAVVDIALTRLAMPKRLIDKLGLCQVKVSQDSNNGGTQTERVFETVRLTIQGHDCLTDVMELPDDGPVRVGAMAIEHLDLEIDPVGRRLIGNLAHNGEQMMELS
jgi:hypothetical protein